MVLAKFGPKGGTAKASEENSKTTMFRAQMFDSVCNAHVYLQKNIWERDGDTTVWTGEAFELFSIFGKKFTHR